jgi:hypothetical protein
MSVTRLLVCAFCALLAGILVEGAKATHTAADHTPDAGAKIVQSRLPPAR